MRSFFVLLACWVTAQPAQADLVQVPLRADGSVNIEAVLSGFTLAFPILADATKSAEMTGELLGEPFAAGVTAGDASQQFSLAIDAQTLSEHGNFLIAVLVTEALCARSSRSPGLVLWNEAKNQNGTIWQVPTSCGATTD